MSMDVHEQLDRLAQRAPNGSPPADLWRRGVRLRRRRAATAVVAALAVGLVVALGAGTAGLAWNRLAAPMQPAGSTTRPAMPARLEQPSPWTPSTARAGAPGRLAVVAGAARRTGVLATERDGLVGISAATGGYRFLDLPGALQDSSGMISTDTPVALSPTGRYVAYWLGGPPAVGARFGRAATGVAVYDTVTGTVRRGAISSPRGLSPERLTWVDDDTVALGYGRVTERDASSMSAVQAPVRLWTPRTGDLAGIAGARAPAPSDDLAPTAGGFSSWDGARLSLFSRRAAAWDRRTLRVRGSGDGGVVNHLVSPDGSRVAVVATRDNTARGLLYVGAVPASGTRVEVRRVDVRGIGTEDSVQSVVGWRDPTHVLVEARRAGPGSGVFAVDVGTGASTIKVAVSDPGYTPGRVYAADLWRTAPIVRPGPARAHDPRLLAGGAGLLVLVVLGGVLAVRRRRAVL